MHSDANMTFIEAVSEVLRQAGGSLTPQEIRDRIKVTFPQFYNTESHQANVAKGHYHHLDHALMAQVYGLVKRDTFVVDRSTKPMKLALRDDVEGEEMEELVSVEDIEEDTGIVYILTTGTHTKDGRAIIKIGITSGDVDQRIRQLYTTGAPYKFDVLKTYQVVRFIELEKALHAMLDKYRLNAAREFFTEDAVPFVERIVSLHREINAT